MFDMYEYLILYLYHHLPPELRNSGWNNEKYPATFSMGNGRIFYSRRFNNNPVRLKRESDTCTNKKDLLSELFQTINSNIEMGLDRLWSFKVVFSQEQRRQDLYHIQMCLESTYALPRSGNQHKNMTSFLTWNKTNKLPYITFINKYGLM